MSRSAPFRLNRSGMMLALVSAAFASQANAAAGRTEFIIGGVTVARNGVERPLARGTELDNGDVVRTNDGRAQIRFTDGAYVSLQPNTDFAIRDYRFENKTDGSERGFFGLVKGAMRTVTGLIGRVNRDRYQIVTPTATVGIRGTGGVIQVQQDGSTLVIGTSGIWSLTNPAGSIDVPAGVSGLSPTDPSEPPSETTTQPTSSPAPLPPKEPEFVAGNEVDESGSALIPQAPPPPFLMTGSGYTAALAYTAFQGQPFLDGGEFGGFESASAVFDASGRMTSITDSGFFGAIQSATLDPATGVHAESGTDGILAWGRWTGTVNISGFEQSFSETYGDNQGFHYVVGTPTAVMPTTGEFSYSLLGTTRPTYADGRLAPGTVTSGTLNVQFTSGVYSVQLVNLGIQMTDTTYRADGSTSNFSGSPFFSMGLTVSSPTSCASTACSGSATGFFAGTNAERAGMAYHISDPDFSKNLIGAAAFKKD